MRVLAIALLSLLPLHAADWVRLRSGDIEVLSDAGERAARDTLGRLLRMRSLLPGTESAPLRIFLFGTEREFRGYAVSAQAAGFYRGAPDRDEIVLNAQAQPARIVLHEYLHLLLHRSPAALPAWFEEGTADFYSNARFSGRGATIGDPIEEHVAVLRRNPQLRARDLDTVQGHSAGMTFYAQSWALVHMLNLAPGYREHLPQFVELLTERPATAFTESFGRTLEQVWAEVPGYLRRMKPALVDAPEPKGSTIQVSAVKQITLELLDLASRSERPDTARSLASAKGLSAAERSAAEGFLALQRGDAAGARDAFRRAEAQGTDEAVVLFELAQVERELDASWPEVERRLRQTLERDPQFAEAHFLLGLHGKGPEAIAHLKSAAEARPRDSSYWRELGWAYAHSGNVKAAGEAALRAGRTALSQEQEEMARALVQSLGSNP